MSDWGSTLGNAVALGATIYVVDRMYKKHFRPVYGKKIRRRKK